MLSFAFQLGVGGFGGVCNLKNKLALRSGKG